MYTPRSHRQMPAARLSRRSVLQGAVLLGVGAAAAGVPLLTASTVHAQVPAPTIHSRGAWNARPPRVTIPIINHPPNKIVVHHTATANRSDTSLERAFSLSRGGQNHHMDTNGWPDAGQQFTISRGGHIMEARSESLPALQAGTSFPQGTHAPTQNTQSIGIENEGTYTAVAPPAALYDSLVHMCAYICSQYTIPPSEIFGHREFSSTQCPGDVLFGMLPQLRADVVDAMDDRASGGGFETVIDSTSDRFRASASWGTSSYSGDAFGELYHFADPLLDSDAAWFRVDVPLAGTYQVDAWWPANAGYHHSTPFVVVTSDGSQTVHVDQRANGGRWVNLGSYPLAAGDQDLVAVSRWATGAGYLIADAIRVRR